MDLVPQTGQAHLAYSMAVLTAGLGALGYWNKKSVASLVAGMGEAAVRTWGNAVTR
jgi:uncharacterized membrane protein (UPF0136 family)